MTAVDARSAALQQVARAPVREPEDERDAQRPDERRGENGVDRAHVRHDRTPAQSGQLTRERSLELRAAQRLPAGAERAHAAVLRQDAGNGAVREHDDLVDQRCERRDLRHGRSERGVPRIDLLRDEDDLAHVGT